jgi:hypothetical protein
MNDPFAIAERYLQEEPCNPAPGRLLAVEICSSILQDHLWLVLDRTFDPPGGQAVYYAEELAILANKTPEQLREIHKLKLAFGPGTRLERVGGE